VLCYVAVSSQTDAGNENLLIWLDSQAWYTSVSTALDAVSLVGAASTFGSTLKMVLNLKKAGTSIPKVLKGLDNKSRKKLTKELILAQNPGMSGKRVKALMRAQKIPKGYAAINISFTARNQLIDALAASLSVAGSAYSGIIKNAPKFIISVVEEVESY